jgi:hypothetical protein
LIRGCRDEVAADQVGGRPDARDADRRPRPFPRHSAARPPRPHQPLDPLAADIDPTPAQRCVDAAGAVGAAAPTIDRDDPLSKPGISECTIRRRPSLPGVEAGAGDAG